MKDKEIVEIQGTIQMQKRYWYQLYKKGWHKHSTLFQKVWIRFKW